MEITYENLRNWFKKEKWVRIGSDGSIKGKCGTSKNKKNPDRCLPYAKAKSLSKAERAATARKKKRAGKKGKKFVPNTKKTKVKMKKEDLMNIIREELSKIMTEKKKSKGKAKRDACYHKVKSRYKDSWPSAYASGALVKCRKVGAANWGNKSKKKNEEVDESALNKSKKNYAMYGSKNVKENIDEIDMHTLDLLEMEVIDENITEAKYKVYVNSGKKNADGSIKVKKVEFGAKGMKIRKSNPKARKAFRARHRCDNPGPKTMARYWSCKKW